MYNLSICAVVANEAPYIKEWIDFHLRQGVERFYLYIDADNNTDNTIDILREYFLNKVSWMRISGPAPQLKAYKHFCTHCKESTKWAAFIDVDEFLFCTLFRLDAYLKDKEHWGGFGVHWLLYGSNGHAGYSPEPVIERFTKRAANVNPHVKSIVQLKYVLSPGNDPHTFYSSRVIVNERGKKLPVHYALEQNGTADVLRINHYCTKSYAEAKARWSLPRADTGEIRNIEDRFNAHDTNEIEDRSAILAREGITEEDSVRYD